MSKIYIFSGLGVDKRVFDRIDFGSMDITFIDWIAPNYNESIQEYAGRISKKITSPNPVLIGLSFGGMIAVEISKLIPTEKIILIASAKTKFELPPLYRNIGKTKLHQIAPASLLKLHHPLADWFFGITSKEDKLLLKNILKDTEPHFLKWAIHQIVSWQNVDIPKNIIHIHGDADRIIPVKNVRADYIVSGGGHFMTVNKAMEISQILQTNLEFSS